MSKISLTVQRMLGGERLRVWPLRADLLRAEDESPEPRSEGAAAVDVARPPSLYESAPSHALCRVCGHAEPWRTVGGELRCRVCHPPAPGAEAS